MITGAHVILYSADAAADKAFFKDVLGFPYVDVGHGWLIFGLPPSEIAVHPAEENGPPEFYLLCEDIAVFVKEMEGRRVPCTLVMQQRWGAVVQITLPGGGKVGVYEPKHARP